MSKQSIEPGGEYNEWAESIKQSVIELGRMSGRVKFVEMKPFDSYQGPYAKVIINGKNDSIWSTSHERYGNLFFIEGLRFTGTIKDLAKALSGNKEAIKKVLSITKEME